MKLLRPLRQLHVQVLVAFVAGCAVGHFLPAVGLALDPVAAGFVKLIKMLIGPIIFCAVAVGIGRVPDMKKVGRVGLKALVYFEAVTTLALAIGLGIANWIKPGAGFHAHASTLDVHAIAAYAGAAKKLSATEYILNIIPTTFVGALTSDVILQVLLIAVLFGLALASVGEETRKIVDLLEATFKVMLRIVGMVVWLAGPATFAAMAYVIAKYGLHSIAHLASLVLCIAITMTIFVTFVLGGVLRLSGIGLWSFLRYLRDEIVLVLGTASSETALPGLMAKMENLGCSKPVVGLVVPAGYSFNLDGSCIYLTMAAIFIAQATDTPLSGTQQILVLLVLMLASKGAAAVSGGAFIVLAATLDSTPVPAAGLTLILGIDRFLTTARALVNLIGNGVAVVVVAAWEGEFDLARAKRVLAAPAVEETRLL